MKLVLPFFHQARKVVLQIAYLHSVGQQQKYKPHTLIVHKLLLFEIKLNEHGLYM